MNTCKAGAPLGMHAACIRLYAGSIQSYAAVYRLHMHSIICRLHASLVGLRVKRYIINNIVCDKNKNLIELDMTHQCICLRFIDDIYSGSELDLLTLPHNSRTTSNIQIDLNYHHFMSHGKKMV